MVELSSKRRGGNGVQVETEIEKFTVMFLRSPQFYYYQNSATLLCPFEMRNELFGDKFSEGVHFPLEFRLDVQQPHKFLDVNKYIQLF